MLSSSIPLFSIFENQERNKYRMAPSLYHLIGSVSVSASSGFVLLLVWYSILMTPDVFSGNRVPHVDKCKCTMDSQSMREFSYAIGDECDGTQFYRNSSIGIMIWFHRAKIRSHTHLRSDQLRWYSLSLLWNISSIHRREWERESFWMDEQFLINQFRHSEWMSVGPCKTISDNDQLIQLNSQINDSSPLYTTPHNSSSYCLPASQHTIEWNRPILQHVTISVHLWSHDEWWASKRVLRSSVYAPLSLSHNGTLHISSDIETHAYSSTQFQFICTPNIINKFKFKRNQESWRWCAAA